MQKLKTLAALIFSLIIIPTLFTLLFLSTISSYFTEENLKKAVSNIDVTHEIKKIQNSSGNSNQEISDIIDTAYTEAEKHGISEKLVNTIFNSNEVKEFLGGVVGTTTNYIINDKKSKAATSKEFNTILDENMDKWIEESGTKISDTKKDVLLIRMKSISAGIINNLPNSKTVDQKISEDTLNKIRFIFSNQVKIALITTILLSLVIIIITKRKQKKYLVYSGSSLLITGLLLIGTSFIITDILTIILTKYNLSFMATTLSNGLSHIILINGLVTAVISIVIFIIYGLINKQKKA